MTPTPPSNNSSAGGGGQSPEEQFRVVRKRNRVPLSCHPCRTRNNCTRREGIGTSTCSYAASASRKQRQSQSEASPDDMQLRIDRLEGLVLSLMHNGPNADAGPPRNSVSTSQSTADGGSSAAQQPRGEEAVMVDDDESDVDDHLAKSIGYLKVDADKGKSMYIGQQHWHLMLADIAEVKNYFMSHKKEFETSYEKVRLSKPATAREGPTLLLGAPPASEMELRSALPHKSCVLVLCSRYLHSMDHAVCMIHCPTFLQQLRDHWQDPSKTPIMWLGLLYAVLCLAMLSYHKVGDEPPEWQGRTLDMAAEYRLRTVQCLMKADYTKPVEYTVETMLLYIFGEYSSRWDADLGLWMIVSLTVRIAFRMGYHRDAKWFPSLTPFQALPNNIYDDELNRDIKELPPARPVTEATPVSYMIAKARLCIELGNILQAMNRVDKGVSYDEIIRFDAKVRQIMQELPPHLKLGSLEARSGVSITLIIARFNIDTLAQKILCLLHRKYLCRARQNPRYAYSRKSAIEASLQAMEHLQTLHRESQSGGPLRTVSWYVKSIATKEFILPAMLIVLDLHYDDLASQAGIPEESEGGFRWTPEQRARMIETLESAANIWKSLAGGSVEAYKGAKTMEIMLQKLKEPAEEKTRTEGGSATSLPQLEVLSSVPNSTAAAEAAALDSTMPASIPGTMPADGPLPDFGAGGDLDSFLNTNSSAFMGMDFSLPASTLNDSYLDGRLNTIGSQLSESMFTDLGGESASRPDLFNNFDWGAFENYAQMANWGADQSFQIYGGGATADQGNRMNTQ
ncbi:hypothetical protein E4U54_001840 [Claviceps lovelessii]|nr:hypothetical protein E4U54_001840 [Claviceps lovelessii]